jgi:hypothetical protein
MTSRRGTRPTHVKPRPPSSGRPATAPVRSRAPAPGRLAVRTPVRRSRGIPLVGQLILAALVVALGGVVLYLGVGGLTTVASGVGSVLTGFVDDIRSTPSPSPVAISVSDAPSIESPGEPYTNQPTADLLVTVPDDVVGDPDYRIRVYLALEDVDPAPIQETPVARLPQTVIPVELSDGINDFTVTLVGPAGESDTSPVVRYVLDTKKPSIKLLAPRDGAVINRKTVELEGRSQARSTLIVRNATTGESIVGSADSDGLFSLLLPITKGSNDIVITATDPAGNSKETELTVTRGSGKLRASLSSSLYSIKRSSLPEPITLFVTVDDPDGRPVAGATATFTLSIPGIKTVTGEVRTDKNGRAVFTTTIPKGATAGGGRAGVFVQTTDFGSTTDETVVTIKK